MSTLVIFGAWTPKRLSCCGWYDALFFMTRMTLIQAYDFGRSTNVAGRMTGVVVREGFDDNSSGLCASQ